MVFGGTGKEKVRKVAFTREQGRENILAPDKLCMLTHQDPGHREGLKLGEHLQWCLCATRCILLFIYY